MEEEILIDSIMEKLEKIAPKIQDLRFPEYYKELDIAIYLHNEGFVSFTDEELEFIKSE